MCACVCVMWQALLEFLKLGYDPNHPNTEGMNPIHTYISRQHKKKYVDLLFFLLAHSSANFNVPNYNGDTPLHLAIKVSHTSLSSSFMGRILLSSCNYYMLIVCVYMYE